MADYIERRIEKDEKIEKTALYLSTKTKGRFTIRELYEAQQTYKQEKYPERQQKKKSKYDAYFILMLNR